MATAKTTAATAKLIREISQDQIIDYDTHVRDLLTLKQALKEKEEIVDALENAYDTMLAKGYTCEAGALALRLDVSTRAKAPKYKELFASFAGPRAVEEAQRAAGVTEIRHVKVVSTKPQGGD